MGYIRHDAIVVTSWSAGAIAHAAAMALKLGLEVLGPSDEATNGYRTMLVCPDCSKEGWDESDACDANREAFLAYLNSVRYSDNSSPLEWVALSYGSDDRSASIAQHAWEAPLKE